MKNSENLNSYNLGKSMSTSEVEHAETRLLGESDQVISRLKLLGFYSQHPSPKSEMRWKQHVIWFVENQAEDLRFGQVKVPAYLSAKGFAQLRTLWLEKIGLSGESIPILLNAAKFLSTRDFQTSEKLWKTVILLNPSDPAFSKELTQLYIQEALTVAEPHCQHYSTLAFEQGDITLANEPQRVKRFQLATSMFEFALIKKELDRARAYCRFQMKIADEMGIFHSDVYERLGRVALQKGNLVSAKRYLMKTLRRPICAKYDLAEELASIGEERFVLNYLKAQNQLFNEDSELERSNESQRRIDFIHGERHQSS